ncbi:unnamed protein product [Fraxinus pennsylvanica]|uniref:CTLH domain-containing protein n=1 Tax=Fraxinus pennsylvanica TaxID=56036 RepID=A0AAD1YZ99_9LAMI|nr:unnamed protein product [Fraxinus pennsylvanica]
MNRLVMNFLVTFRMESGTELNPFKLFCRSNFVGEIDLETITDRIAVKKAVQSGHVGDAIEKINDLNPEILDTHPQLFFHLQLQRLIELIRNGKVDEALEFAQEELAPRGEENSPSQSSHTWVGPITPCERGCEGGLKAFLEELERTVALLAFEDVTRCPVDTRYTSPTLFPSPTAKFDRINKECYHDFSKAFLEELERTVAMLAFKYVTRCPVDPKLPSLLKMLIWAQNQLDEKAAYPRISDLCTTALEDPAVSKPRTVPRTSS